MKNEIEQELHEKLCAYVLGEGSAEERAEVERALESDADLRLERARLERTIGVVRAMLGDAESLSAQATETLLASARPRRPWYTRPSLRLAAGIGVLLGAGAVWILRARHQEAQRQESLAYHPFGDEERRRDEPREKRLAKNEEPRTEQEPLIAMAETAPPAVPAPEGVIPLETKTGTYRGPGDSLPPGDGGVFKQPAESLAVAAVEAPSAPVDGARGLEALGYGGSAAGAAGAQPYPEVIDRVAPARGEVAQDSGTAVGGTAIGAGRPTTGSTASAYGGRKFGSGVARAGGPSPTGPSTGGPSGPAAPAPPTSGSPRADSREVLQRLGYVGAGADSSPEATPTLPGLVQGGDDFFLGVRDGFKPAFDPSTLSPAERDAWVDEQCRQILQRCHRRPHERPRDMFFRFWGDNPFETTALDAQSTFSVDVDTASYTLARRYVSEGNLPEKAQVRTEEFVNYFKADVAAPLEGTFAIHTDLAPSRFSADAQRSMLRVVVRGREVAKTERKPLALTFVIDVSGSMREQNRLEMVKHTLRLLLSQLDANDSIAIVSFSSDARMILPMTSAANRGLIESALFPLQPSGSTNSQAGLRMGYEAALAGLNANATNRVVFLSDGVANVGVTDPNAITNEVQRIREKGIFLNTIGVGMNNHNDVLLEQLADKGDGVCNYVDTAEEARRVMVDGFTGAFETIARDVKVQVEFDPAQVARYRLLGYENRAVADQDFRNDRIDAGEVGAGHQVTALYELELAGQASEKPLATVRLRWKAPRQAGPSADLETEQSTEIERAVVASQRTSFEGAGTGYRRAVIVAQFAEILRRSVHARGESLDDLIAEAQKLERELHDPEFTELYLLMQKSKALILARVPRCDDLCQAVDLLRHHHLMRAEHELLAHELDAKLLEDLERQNRELEARIRDLVRRQLDDPKPRVR